MATMHDMSLHVLINPTVSSYVYKKSSQERCVGTQSVILSAKRDSNVSKLGSYVSQVHVVLPMHALVCGICLELRIHPSIPKVPWKSRPLLGCVEWHLLKFASLQVHLEIFLENFLFCKVLDIKLFNYSLTIIFLFKEPLWSLIGHPGTICWR